MRTLMVLAACLVALPASSQESGRALLKSFGVDEPAMAEPRCFTVSRAGGAEGIIILLNQCDGDSWYLDTSVWGWKPIRKAEPTPPN